MSGDASYLRAVAGGVELTVKVVPGASRDRIAGPLGDALKIQVSAPPEKGKANAAVIALLSRALAIPSKQIRVTHGETSPRKTLRIAGLDAVIVLTRLGGR